MKKLPLGGVDRRAMVPALAEHGPKLARELLAEQRANTQPHRSGDSGLHPEDAVVVLGGSNGITRGLVIQILFGEGASVYAVHLDSEKMQIGPHHTAAIAELASKEGRTVRFFNRDATKPETIEEVLAAVGSKHRAVHLINGIAAGATKRYQEHGPAQVKDIDVAFDLILQAPDFSKPENIRRLGLVDVEVATEVDIERTNKFMGTSSLLWAEPMHKAGLLMAGTSVVGFCDYDYPPEDPVYAMGPLAGAKVLQRKTMSTIRERFGAKTARLCYPALATTALGAIPGGLLMFGLTAQILKERKQFRDIPALNLDAMRMFDRDYDGADIRLDGDYQNTLPEFFRRRDALTPADIPGAFSALFAA